MIDMFAPERKPGSGVEPGESLEVSDEMSLIEIAAGRRDAGPIELTAVESSVLQRAQDLLKPPDPAKQLWCQPNFLAEQLDESSGTETDLFGHLRDGSRPRFVSDLRQGK